MNLLDHPIRFQPYLRPMVWGGRALARFAGKDLPATEPIGESWEVSDHTLHHSVVASGTLRGKTLRHLMQDHAAGLLGHAADRHAAFPWLIKLLDAADWLSVQVHPDERQVARWLPGEGAKTEAWLVLDASPGSRIYAGLKHGVRPADFRRALERGAVIECLHSFTPRSGDLVFLPAGTVHGVGGGVLMAEVQQTSDATFRLYDWDRRDAHGRPRALHLEPGVACIDWESGPVEPLRLRTQMADGMAPLLTCPHFILEELQAARAVRLGGDGRMRALIVIGGEGRLDCGEPFGVGEVWLLPAAMPAHSFHPTTPMHALVATLP